MGDHNGLTRRLVVSVSFEGPQMAVGQNPSYHFGVGAPPMLVYCRGDWDVHWWYGILPPHDKVV